MILNNEYCNIRDIIYIDKGAKMINIILQTEKAKEIELSYQNQREKDCIFIPKRVYGSIYTVEEMLSIHKIDVDIESFIPILNDYGITDIGAKMSTLTDDQQLFVHTLAFISIERKIVFIDIPPNDLSEDRLKLFFEMVFSYECLHEEINLITDNQQIIDAITELKSKKTPTNYDLKVYEQKVDWWRIARKFSGGLYIFGAHIVLATILISCALLIDNIMASDFVPHVSIPNNMIILDNTQEACEFNEIAYNVPFPTCSKNQRYSFDSISSIIADENVEAIYFEDMERIDQVEKDISNGEAVEISIPYFAESISPYFSRLFCDEGNQLVTCSDYSADNSIIGILTETNNEALVRNREYSSVNPDYIFVISNDVTATSEKLARMNPAVKALTNQSINEYRTYSNRHFIILLIFVGISLSLTVVIILYLQLRNMKITFGGLRYFADHLTMNRKKVKVIYFGVQCFNFLYIVTFIYFVVSNITYYQITTQIITVFAMLNSLLWLYFCSLPGREYYSQKNYVLHVNKDSK